MRDPWAEFVDGVVRGIVIGGVGLIDFVLTWKSLDCFSAWMKSQ